MSNKRLTEVWEKSKQSGVKLLALLSLADRADDDGYCWPSHKDTAQRARSARTYILTILREIAADGELYIHAEIGGPHKYLVLPGMTEAEIRKALAHRFGYSVGEIDARVSVILTCQLGRQGVSVQQTGGVSSTEHEPSLTQNNKTHKEPKERAAKPAAPSEPAPKVPSAQQIMFQALADVTMMDMKLNAARLGKAATALIKAEYTPEQVTGLFLPGGLWYLRDWRGQRGDPPTPEQVGQMIRALMSPEYQDAPVRTNGHKQTVFERNMQAYQQLLQEVENEQS